MFRPLINQTLRRHDGGTLPRLNIADEVMIAGRGCITAIHSTRNKRYSVRGLYEYVCVCGVHEFINKLLNAAFDGEKKTNTLMINRYALLQSEKFKLCRRAREHLYHDYIFLFRTHNAHSNIQ